MPRTDFLYIFEQFPHQRVELARGFGMRAAVVLPALLELAEDFGLTGHFAFEPGRDAQEQVVSIDATQAIDARMFCRAGLHQKGIARVTNQQAAQAGLDAEVSVRDAQQLERIARRLALLALVDDEKLVENHGRMLRGGLSSRVMRVSVRVRKSSVLSPC